MTEHNIMRGLNFLGLAAVLLMAGCGENRAGSFDPRDTVQVPEGLTGEDSIAYIENAIFQSPITAEQLLSLAEVHSLEECLYYYNNFEMAEDNPEDAANYLATYRDSCAMRLANRFLRMHYLVYNNGKAQDKMQFAVAVNTIVDNFHAEMPELPRDSVIGEVSRVVSKFSALSQVEMNLESYIDAALDYYLTIDAYRQWLADVPPAFKKLAEEEYVAWHDFNEARFTLWRDVSYRQEWYSMKPMEMEYYHSVLSQNRRAELAVERDIVLNAKLYRQLGRTVTTSQWEAWIAKSSEPEDADFLRELDDETLDIYMPDEATVTECVGNLRSTFQRWLAARQALAAALPEAQRKSYDNLTADMHARIIGTLPSIVPLP